MKRSVALGLLSDTSNLLGSLAIGLNSYLSSYPLTHPVHLLSLWNISAHTVCLAQNRSILVVHIGAKDDQPRL